MRVVILRWLFIVGGSTPSLLVVLVVVLLLPPPCDMIVENVVAILILERSLRISTSANSGEVVVKGRSDLVHGLEVTNSESWWARGSITVVLVVSHTAGDLECVAYLSAVPAACETTSVATLVEEERCKVEEFLLVNLKRIPILVFG